MNILNNFFKKEKSNTNMFKVKIDSKQGYINYCTKKEILNFPRRFGSSYVYINDSSSIKNPIVVDSKNAYIDKEPRSYPCIFMYHISSDDNIYGGFIYENDFRSSSKKYNNINHHNIDDDDVWETYKG